MLIFCFVLLSTVFCGATKIQNAWIVVCGNNGEAWLNGHPVYTWVTQTARAMKLICSYNSVTTYAKSIPSEFFLDKNVLSLKNSHNESEGPVIDVQYLLAVVLDDDKKIYFTNEEDSIDNTKLLHNPETNIVLQWTNSADSTLGYLTRDDIANHRMEPLRYYDELGPKNWREVDFDDSGWKDEIYPTSDEDFFPSNPETGMRITFLTSYKNGWIDRGVINVVDYYRRYFTLPIEATPKTDANSTPVTTP